MRINLWSGHFAVAVSMLYASSSMSVIISNELDPVAASHGTVRITVPSPEVSAPEDPEESTQTPTSVVTPENSEESTQTAAPSAASNNNSEVLEEDPWTKKSKTQQGLKELNEEAYNIVTQRLSQGQITIAAEQRKEKKRFFKFGQSLEKSVESTFFAQALKLLEKNINSDGTVKPEIQWRLRGTYKKYNEKLIEEYNKIRFTELKNKYSK